MWWFLPVRSGRKHARVHSYRTATCASNTGTKRSLLFLAGGAAAAEELRSVLGLGAVGRLRGWLRPRPTEEKHSWDGQRQRCPTQQLLRRSYVTGLGWK